MEICWQSEKDKASAIEGIAIADKIITSNYFKKIIFFKNIDNKNSLW